MDRITAALCAAAIALLAGCATPAPKPVDAQRDAIVSHFMAVPGVAQVRSVFGFDLSDADQPVYEVVALGYGGKGGFGGGYTGGSYVRLHRVDASWDVEELNGPPVTSEVYQRVGGRVLGFSVEVPAGWVQDPDVYVWRSPAGTPRVAFGYTEHDEKRAGQPPDETKLLPGGAQQVEIRRYWFGWSDGAEYTLSYPAPESRREVHLLLPPGKGPYRDLYSVAAPDPAATALADREWEHLLASLVVAGG